MIQKIITFLLFSSFFHAALSQSGWIKLTTTGTITGRSNSSMIFHPVNNSLIVFGGNTSGGYVNELWSLDLNTNTWSLIPAKSGNIPAPRHTHHALYDSLQNRMLVWSGQGSVLYNDVWAFHFSDSTWVNLFADGNISGAPLKRYGSASIFDPTKRRLINFAGFTTAGRFEDTWSFSVDSLSWNDYTNNPHPLKRCLTSQCYADDRREMIVYAGQSSGNLDDIWSLDMDTYSWTDLTPAIKPAPRNFTTIVYAGKGNVLMFGGNAPGSEDDLWRFSLVNNTWDTVPQGMLRPDKRNSHSAVFIPQQDKMIVFGGSGSSLFNDTWVYEGVSTVLNVKEKEKEKEKTEELIRVYPNPVRDVLTLHFLMPVKEIVSVGMYTLEGKSVKNIYEETGMHASENILVINIESVPYGIYLVRILTHSGMHVSKIVVGKK